MSRDTRKIDPNKFKYTQRFTEYVYQSFYEMPELQTLQFKCRTSSKYESCKIWVQKELSRWKRKIGTPNNPTFDNFKGTLLNLEIVCTLLGVSPSEILTPNEIDSPRALCINRLTRHMNDDGIITLLPLGAIQNLALSILNTCLDFSNPLIIPVLYAPKTMHTLYLSISQTKTFSQITAPICMSFCHDTRSHEGLSNPGVLNYTLIPCGTHSYSIMSKSMSGKIDLSSRNRSHEIQAAYENAIEEFNCYDEPTNIANADTIYMNINALYHYVPKWTQLTQQAYSPALFEWFPAISDDIHSSSARRLTTLNKRVSDASKRAPNSKKHPPSKPER